VNLPVNSIIHGKCLEVLRNFPDASVDSIVTDVPYGLGNKDPTVEEIIAYLQGSDLRTGEFMNKDWEIPSVLVWKECFRVLKPGGFVLTFAGTRTQDLISIGVRAAGFQNRDTIDVEMGPPFLRWIRAQGMPKSTDVAKSLRKSGAEPEVVDPWEGWGTALKPYWEPVLMFRKPILEKTLVEQVKTTGSGAINIDGCRVKHASPEDFAKHKAGVDAIKARGGVMANSWKNSSDLSGANEVTTGGRFPPNVIFVHSELCRKVGTTTAPVPPINRFNDGAKPFGGGAGHEYSTIERGDEVLTVWECHHSCPVSWLNKQSGPMGIVDSGGASRFFLNVDPGSMFFYVPKPSADEKNDGLSDDAENEHSTVKPIRLMEYLVRLVTRKGGVVLDPYCGSGSTCVAAVNEGMDFIGIEKELPSFRTAQARTLKALRTHSERETQAAAFDLSMTLESE